ncbi:MAG: zinc-ribbon domain-containing protein [Hyphomicrobiales bacterium]
MDSHPIIICEECGKKYRVDTGKILGQVAGFTCRSCGHRILVTRPQPVASEPLNDAPGQRPGLDATLASDRSSRAEPVGRRARPPGMSLQAKALLVWFILPAVIAVTAGFLFLEQAEEMVSIVNRETFFMLLLLWSGVVLSGQAIGLWFGLKLTGRIRRLAEAAERVESASQASGDELRRLERVLVRIENIMSPPGAERQRPPA